jgi:hypothetical protein
MKWILAAAAAVAMAQPKVPRAAPEFQIIEASGSTAKLSSFRGNVVLLAFVVTSCPHCLSASKEFEKLKAEFGLRGLLVAETASMTTAIFSDMSGGSDSRSRSGGRTVQRCAGSWASSKTFGSLRPKSS